MTDYNSVSLIAAACKTLKTNVEAKIYFCVKVNIRWNKTYWALLLGIDHDTLTSFLGFFSNY